MKFTIKDFFSKCNQIRSLQWNLVILTQWNSKTLIVNIWKRSKEAKILFQPILVLNVFFCERL